MATIVDSDVAYGSLVLTFDSVAYVAEDIDWTQDSINIEQRNQVGIPAGQVNIEGFVSGTATLQLATAATAMPVINGISAAVDLGRGGTKKYFITSVGKRFSHVGEIKIPISFKEYITAPA